MKFKMVETALDIRRHDLLQDLAEKGAEFAIEKLKVDQDLACDFGNQLADFFSTHWNGQSIYIAADSRYHLSKRDLDIFHRMKRGEANALAKEYNISFVRVHQIHRHILSIVRKAAQPTLFEDPDASPGAELSTGQKAKG